MARFRRHLGAGDVDAALAAWTGTPLAGLDVPGLTAAVDGLVEQWLGAVEDDLGRRVATDAAATIAPLTELTADHPFREGLWALLMTALYRAGRQADALAAYQRARQHLVQQLGVEPGPRLRELEARILDHDERLHGEPASPAPAWGRPTGTMTFGFAEVAGATRLWVEHRRKVAPTWTPWRSTTCSTTWLNGRWSRSRSTASRRPRVLAYLDTTGGFGVLARDTLVADAVGRIAADTHIRNEAGQDLDARQALAYMRDVLDDLGRSDAGRQVTQPSLASERIAFFDGEPLTWASTVGRCGTWCCASSHPCRHSGGASPSSSPRSAHGEAGR